MKLARVVGTVVLSKCVEPYTGRTLHITRTLDKELMPAGDPEVSATWKSMREGDMVIVELSREAANAFDPPMPIDSVIIGKVDKVNINKQG